MTSSEMTTATVETLTAEVRVLAVGNRQITLSVAKQLDFVELHDLTVFGRVKLGSSAPDDLVIGSDLTGNLALARYRTHQKPHDWSAFLEVDADWPDCELPEVGWAIRTDRAGFYRLQFGSGDSAISVEILKSNCRFKDGEKEFHHAHSEWWRQKNEWRKNNGTDDGFELPEPERKDFGAYGWNPGPHWAELELSAHQQLAEAERNHQLYEAAKSSPLIVLAGLK